MIEYLHNEYQELKTKDTLVYVNIRSKSSRVKNEVVNQSTWLSISNKLSGASASRSCKNAIATAENTIEMTIPMYVMDSVKSSHRDSQDLAVIVSSETSSCATKSLLEWDWISKREIGWSVAWSSAIYIMNMMWLLLKLYIVELYLQQGEQLYVTKNLIRHMPAPSYRISWWY